jgi:hypothetical protein
MKKIIIEKHSGNFDNGLPYEVHYSDDTSIKVSIFEINQDWKNPNKKKEYGINWSALGTVNENEAEQYVKLIEEAIKVCSKLNA